MTPTQTDWEPNLSAIGNAALTAWHQHRTDTTFGAGKRLAGQAAIEEYRRQMAEAGLVVVRRDLLMRACNEAEDFDLCHELYVAATLSPEDS